MVIVRLKGGLGNQMFQYAAARRMALAHNVPLKLDISWFGHAAVRTRSMPWVSKRHLPPRMSCGR